MNHNNYFIYGTQKRFEENIVNIGLERPEAGVFYINDNFNKGSLLLTFMISLYHAISLRVQNNILEEGYYNITNFYKDNPKFLPLLFFFESYIGNTSLKNEKKYYTKDGFYDLITYPYYNIEDIGKLNYIIHKKRIDIKDVLEAEKYIKSSLYEDEYKNRFFNKLGDDNDNKNKKLNHDKLNDFRLISNKYIFNFCYNLYIILSEKY